MAYPELTKLEGKVRESSKATNRELRADKRVPAVLYGPEIKQNINFSVSEIELEKILRKNQTKLQELTVDGKTYKTLLKRTDFDPVTDRPIHADFYVLSDKHPVTLRVPVVIKGNSKGVVESGGRLFQPMKEVRIKVAPGFIPAIFDVDITPLEVGQSFHVGDLDLEGITPIDSVKRTIINVRPPKGAAFMESLEAVVGEEEALEAAESAEEAKAEGAEGSEGETPEEKTEE